jgi:DNA-binding response OmpR family regulator
MPYKPIIAVVDDNPIACEVLAVNLEDRYDVRAFHSGSALLDSLTGQPVDLLLLDVEMPELDGYETCRLLRAGHAQPNVPVIFISARDQLDDRLKGYAAGGSAYLVKPYDLDELQAKILLAIDHHRRTQDLAGEVAELSHAASLTAEMLGEVGVVLEFQRAMTACATPSELAAVLLETLSRFSMEGCLRLNSARSTVTCSSGGPASALEASLLDHLAARPDARIVTIGQNLGFSYGSVTLLVRCLAWTTAPDAPETADAMGRARDNIALLVEGAITRLRALDAEQDARQLAGAHSLITMMRSALLDLQVVEHELHAELDGVFEALSEEFEMRFPQLGLTAEQEDSLANILTRHRARGLAVLERGKIAEMQLLRLVEQLEAPPTLVP